MADQIWQLFTTNTSTRVLKILSVPQDGDYKIVVQLRVIDLEDVAEGASHYISYVALSYTWGSPVALPGWDEAYSKRHDVTIGVQVNDGQVLPFEIGRNLYEGLLELWNLETGHWYWIDAICINQTNLEEKSVQVAMMSQIYAKAALVVIWPGAGDLASVASFFTDIVAALTEYYMEHGEVMPDIKYGYHEIDGLSLGGLMVPRSTLRSVAAFYAERRYFNRVWVLQEAALSKEVQILLGQQLLPLKVLADVQAVLSVRPSTKLWLRRGGSSELSGNGTELFETWRGAAWAEMLHDPSSIIVNILKVCYDVTDGQSMYAAIWLHYLGTMQRRYATDPRDHIFAFISLINSYTSGNPGLARVVPDYTRSIRDVYIDITKMMLSSLNNLSVLSLNSAPSDDLELPSWVPDYSRVGQGTPFQVTACILWSRYSSFGPSYQPGSGRIRIHDNQLNVSGYRMGRIAKLKAFSHNTNIDSPLPPVYIKLMAEILQFLHDLPATLQGNTQSMLENAFRVLCLSCEAGDGVTPTRFAEMMRNYLSELVADMEWIDDDARIANSDWVAELRGWLRRFRPHRCIPDDDLLDELVEQCRSGKLFADRINAAVHGDTMDDFMEQYDESEDMQAFKDVQQRMNDIAADKILFRISEDTEDTVTSLFVTNDQYIGRTLTRRVQVDDEVWLLDGAKVPLLLRPDKDHHRLIGEAFVHGMMYWEPLENTTQKSQGVVIA